uniref:Uncharacterized protein n=1 Tax=Setaria italica TaxID=4555 RepID=K3ZPD9_SETIT
MLVKSLISQLSFRNLLHDKICQILLPTTWSSILLIYVTLLLRKHRKKS